MPMYEYQCKPCGHKFEKIQSFSAEPLKECPICQGEVERLISAPAVQFKGSGFYSTDYGAKPAGNSSSPPSSSSSSDSSSGESSTSKGETSGGKQESRPSPAPSSGGTST